MTKRFIPFPKIPQFNGTIKELINDIQYSGMEEVDGKPVATFNRDIELGSLAC